MSVHLYDVDRVSVESDISLDHLTTEEDSTQLHINMSENGGYHFTIQGFHHDNINVTSFHLPELVDKVYYATYWI